MKMKCMWKVNERKYTWLFLRLGLLLLFSHSVVSDSLQSHGLQHASPPCQSLTPGVYSNSCPLSRWCYPTISSSVFPFSLAFNLSQHQGLFKWVSSSHQVAKVLEFQLQHQSFQWTFRTFRFPLGCRVHLNPCISCFGRSILYHWAPWEALGSFTLSSNLQN